MDIQTFGTPREERRRVSASWLVFCALLLAGLCGAAVRADDEPRLHWKPVEGANVKLDDKVPLTWNVYQLEKKKQPNRVLILLGRRYLMVDSKTKQVFLVFPQDIRAAGEDFESGDLAQAKRALPTSEWTIRDVGPAEQIQVTLGDYRRVLTLLLPHPLNIQLGIY